MRTQRKSRCIVAQCFGWTSVRSMAQQYQASCQSHKYERTGCGPISDLKLEIKASGFVLFNKQDYCK